MIDIDKIEEVAKRHGNDADWQGAAIAYQTHVTPSDVLELVGLIHSQEVALKISHEKFDAEAARCKAMSDYAEQLKSEMAAIPAQTGMISVTAGELSCVINWLEGGRDPKDAAKELRLYCEREWKAAKPIARLPKWIDDQKGSDPNTDALIEYIEQMRGDLPVQQPAPVADERAAYEAWMRKEYASDSYSFFAWAGWQARAALAAPVAAPVAGQEPVYGYCMKLADGTYNNWRDCTKEHYDHLAAWPGDGFKLRVLFAAPVPAASIDKVAFHNDGSEPDWTEHAVAEARDAVPAASVQPRIVSVEQMFGGGTRTVKSYRLATEPDSGRDAAVGVARRLLENSNESATTGDITICRQDYADLCASLGIVLPDDFSVYPANVAQPVSDAALEMKNAIIDVIRYGHLHDEAPTAKLARQLLGAIERDPRVATILAAAKKGS